MVIFFHNNRMNSNLKFLDGRPHPIPHQKGCLIISKSSTERQAMGRKSKRPDASAEAEAKEEIFCFFCKREFDDERNLIVHQKSKVSVFDLSPVLSLLQHMCVATASHEIACF